MSNFFETNDVSSVNNTGSPSDTIDDGVFAERATITGGKNLSGKPLDWMGGKSFDIAVELELDIGRSFNPTVTLLGNYKRDTAGNIVGWGGAFKLPQLMADLGIQGRFHSDGSVPVEMLRQLVGRSVYRACYVSGAKEDGKLKYTNYDRLVPEQHGIEALKELWLADRKNGYPKNYRPALLDHSGASGGYTTDAEALMGHDDDLPF